MPSKPEYQGGFKLPCELSRKEDVSFLPQHRVGNNSAFTRYRSFNCVAVFKQLLNQHLFAIRLYAWGDVRIWKCCNCSGVAKCNLENSLESEMKEK